MRVITSIRIVCGLLLITVPGVPAVAAAQLDSGNGLQASREVSNPPPAANSRPGAARPGSGRSQTAQAARRPAPASSASGKSTPR